MTGAGIVIGQSSGCRCGPRSFLLAGHQHERCHQSNEMSDSGSSGSHSTTSISPSITLAVARTAAIGSPSAPKGEKELLSVDIWTLTAFRVEGRT